MVGEGADRRFIVQWDRVQFVEGNGDEITFQVEFYEATDRIQINYLDLEVNGPESEGATATVGVKGDDDQFEDFSVSSSLTWTVPISSWVPAAAFCSRWGSSRSHGAGGLRRLAE